jgi:hypothetical protein
MNQLKRVGYLQIAEDMDAQRRDWKFQRICTVVMALAGLLGMFGGAGLMSRTAAGDKEAQPR